MTCGEKLAQIRSERDGFTPAPNGRRRLNLFTIAAAILLAVMVWAFAVDGGRVKPLNEWLFNESQAAEKDMGLVKHGQGQILGTEETVPDDAKPTETEEDTEDAEAQSAAPADGDSRSGSGPGD